MPLRRPEDFVAEGSRVFRKAPVNRESIQGWVAIAGDKAKDSLNNDNSTSTRLGAAYDAVFNLSLAVLASQGWRCTSADGHHVQALEAACACAGATQAAFDQMDAVRDVRNNQYNGVPPSEADVALAQGCMNRLVPQLMAVLQPVLVRK
ncbi:MAG: hypothetical protein QM750_02000 [Rubrivivax sp.]